MAYCHDIPDEGLPHGQQPRIYSDDGNLVAVVGNANQSQAQWERSARELVAAASATWLPIDTAFKDRFIQIKFGLASTLHETVGYYECDLDCWVVLDCDGDWRHLDGSDDPKPVGWLPIGSISGSRSPPREQGDVMMGAHRAGSRDYDHLNKWAADESAG